MIVYFIEYDMATGAVIFHGQLDEPVFRGNRPTEGRAWLALPYAAFLPDGGINLDLLRTAHWQAVRQARDAAEWWGCDTPHGRVDTDADSQRKVVGADRLAEKLGAAFTVNWTMQDNSAVVHDAAAMSALAVAVGLHVAACHGVAQVKRAAIDAATTTAGVLSVNPLEGWPDAP